MLQIQEENPLIGPEGHDQLADGDARGSGGVPSPPGLPVRPNPGSPPGDSGDDGWRRRGTQMRQRRTRLFIDPLESQMMQHEPRSVLMTCLHGCISP